jgi:hypothetical protein
MKAEDLANELMKHPDREVMIAIDPEGNAYRKLAEASDEFMCSVDNEPLDPEHNDVSNAVRAFVLWPY